MQHCILTQRKAWPSILMEGAGSRECREAGQRASRTGAVCALSDKPVHLTLAPGNHIEVPQHTSNSAVQATSAVLVKLRGLTGFGTGYG